MIYPDVCQLHQHQHAKFALPGLSKHICAHYSMGNLDRLAHVRQEKLVTMRASLRHRCKRIVGPPPGGGVKLSDIADILFDPTAAYHQRRTGVSKWIHNVQLMCRFSNDDIHSRFAKDGWIVHHCWNHESGAPCCEDEAVSVAHNGFELRCRVHSFM